jgi:hypothetical protein
MLRIRLVHRTIIVAALVVGLLFASTLRPTPALADSDTTEIAIIVGVAFASYLVLVLTVTTIIYYQREKSRKEPSPQIDPYSFTSSRFRQPASSGALQFGSKCSAHGPGTLFCW